jgi:PKD repeat protein
VTWEYLPTDYGMWTGRIVNNGLRTLMVDVYDSTSGVLVSVMHQRIQFAKHDAYPTGTVDTTGVIMSPLHTYSITVTPNGPKGAYCDVEDMYRVPIPPVAVFTAVPYSLQVTVDASGSYDPDGTITSYSWNFDDGGSASGVMATHTYAANGVYTITLTVTDNEGLASSASEVVTIQDNPPIASFTYARDGLSLNFDASGSSDDYGIVNYAWSWGDEMFGSGVTASHGYDMTGAYTVTLTVKDVINQTGTMTEIVSVAPLPIASFTWTTSGPVVDVDASGSISEAGIVSFTWYWGDGSAPEVTTSPTASHMYSESFGQQAAASSTGRAPPGFPFTVAGFTYLSDGVTLLPGAMVTVTNTRTGEAATVFSDAVGYYSIDINERTLYPSGYLNGDIINATAVSGVAIGWNEGVADEEVGFLLLNVLLSGTPEVPFTITLIVTDALGQTATVSQTVGVHL